MPFAVIANYRLANRTLIQEKKCQTRKVFNPFSIKIAQQRDSLANERDFICSWFATQKYLKCELSLD